MKTIKEFNGKKTEDTIEAMGCCRNCGQVLTGSEDLKSIEFRVGTGTIFINTKYFYCINCGIDREAIKRFYKALETSTRNIIKKYQE